MNAPAAVAELLPERIVRLVREAPRTPLELRQALGVESSELLAALARLRREGRVRVEALTGEPAELVIRPAP